MKRTLGLLALAALAAGACSSDDAATASPAIVVEGTASSSAPADGQDAGADQETDGQTAGAASTDEELALEFAACMRSEGIDFDDPIVNADGSIDLLRGGGPGGDGGPDEATRAAFEVCGPIIQGASFLPGDGDVTEIEDQLLEFAECLREQGLDVDDPDLSEGFGAGRDGGGPAGLFGDGFDPSDPANAEAIEACQSLFAGGFGPRAGE